MDTATLGGVGSGRESSAPTSVAYLGFGSSLLRPSPEGTPHASWQEPAPGVEPAGPRGTHGGGRTRWTKTGASLGRSSPRPDSSLEPTYTRRFPRLRHKSSGYVGSHTTPECIEINGLEDAVRLADCLFQCHF